MAIENSNREIRMESLSEAEETRNTAAEEIGAKQTEVEENVTDAGRRWCVGTVADVCCAGACRGE